MYCGGRHTLLWRMPSDHMTNANQLQFTPTLTEYAALIHIAGISHVTN